MLDEADWSLEEEREVPTVNDQPEITVHTVVTTAIYTVDTEISTYLCAIFSCR